MKYTKLDIILLTKLVNDECDRCNSMSREELLREWIINEILNLNEKQMILFLKQPVKFFGILIIGRKVNCLKCNGKGYTEREMYETAFKKGKCIVDNEHSIAKDYCWYCHGEGQLLLVEVFDNLKSKKNENIN